MKIDDCTVILDAGCKWEKIVENINLNQVDMAYISHEHKDHSSCLENLLLSGVSVLSGIDNEIYVKKRNLRAKNSEYEVLLVPIQHGETKNSALILKNDKECILYATDFNCCEIDLSEYKFTHILVECNFIESKTNKIDKSHKDYDKVRRQINTHMGLNGLQIFLDGLDLTECREIDLIHMSQGYGNSEIMGSTIYSRYRIKTGVCKQWGGIEYYGG